MGIVTFITIGAVMFFLPLGIVKGLIQKFLFPEDSVFYTISVNVVLHTVGVGLICYGGYYCSQESLIQYSFATTANFLFIFLIGSFLFCLDVFINSASLRHFFQNRCTPDKPLLKYIYCLSLFWWLIFMGFFLTPLFLNKYNVAEINLKEAKKQNTHLKSLEFINKYSSSYAGKRIDISSSPYGGIILLWGKEKRHINYQTFFYRWKPASFIFIPSTGSIILKVNNEFFSYNI